MLCSGQNPSIAKDNKSLIMQKRVTVLCCKFACFRTGADPEIIDSGGRGDPSLTDILGEPYLLY